MAGPTLFFLENSRAFRVAWLLRELGLQHELRVYKRLEGKKAVSWFEGCFLVVGKSNGC